MGAFSEDPEHFYRWVQDRGVRAEPGDFLPRRLYRDYILFLMHEALRARAGDLAFEHIRGEVMDIEIDGIRATVHLEGRKPFTADRVVLAIGNFPPRHPSITHRSVQRARGTVATLGTPTSSTSCFLRIRLFSSARVKRWLISRSCSTSGGTREL